MPFIHTDVAQVVDFFSFVEDKDPVNKEYSSQNVIWKVATILSQPRCVNLESDGMITNFIFIHMARFTSIIGHWRSHFIHRQWRLYLNNAAVV